MSEQANMNPVPVYVPVAGGFSYARPGAAIVGSPDESGRVTIDFEDGKYVPGVFADLCNRAWSRHVTRYPTVARATVDESSLILVGWFLPSDGRVLVELPEILEEWAPAANRYLLTTSGPAARERDYQAFLQKNPQFQFGPGRSHVRRMLGLPGE